MAGRATATMRGLIVNADDFGTLSLSSTASVFDPRQIVMNVRLRF